MWCQRVKRSIPLTPCPNSRHESVSSADDSQSSVVSIPPYSTAHQKPVYHMTPQDHNYSKQKSSGGETSDASCEVKETGTETDGSQSSEEMDAAPKSSDGLSQGATVMEALSDAKSGTGVYLASAFFRLGNFILHAAF